MSRSLRRCWAKLGEAKTSAKASASRAAAVILIGFRKTPSGNIFPTARYIVLKLRRGKSETLFPSQNVGDAQRSLAVILEFELVGVFINFEFRGGIEQAVAIAFFVEVELECGELIFAGARAADQFEERHFAIDQDADGTAFGRCEILSRTPLIPLSPRPAPAIRIRLCRAT